MVKVIHHLKQKLYARQESLFWNGGETVRKLIS